MRQRLTYDIAVSENEVDWKSVVRGDEVFSRSPEEVARSVLESWIIEHPEQMAGGERVIVPTERHPYEDDVITATVRVQLYEGGKDDHQPDPVAVGYLGHDKRDYTGEIPVAQGDVWDRARRYAADARTTLRKHRGKAGAAAAAASLVAGIFAVKKFRASRKRPSA